MSLPGDTEAVVTPPPGHPRFPLIDSLRGVAAVFILVGHAATLSGATQGTWYRGFFAHNAGLAMFFMVSGFVIYRPFVAHRVLGARNPGIKAFARRRFLRILPAYWLALTALAIYPGLPGVFEKTWWVFYGLMQLVPIYDTSECARAQLGCGIPTAASLPGELGIYFLLPFYALLMYRIARGAAGGGSLRRELFLLAVLAAASVAARVLIVTDDQLVPSALSLILLYGPPGTFLWFAVGMGMAAVSVARERRPVAPRAVELIATRPWLCWLGAAAIFSVLAFAYPSPVLSSDPDESTVALEFVGLGLAGALVMLPAVFGQEAGGFVRRVLANPVLAWLGVISYGIYLYHLPIELELVNGVGLPRQGTFAALVLASFVLTVICAAASYYFFERPILRFKEPRRGGRSVRPPVAGPAPQPMASIEAPPPAKARPSAAARPPAWALPSGLLLIVCLLVAGFAAVASVVIPLLGRTNGTDWLLYLSTIAVLVPGAFVCGRRLAATADAAGGPAAVAMLGALAAVGLPAVGIVARIVYALGGSSSLALLLALVIWGGALVWAARSRALRATRMAELLRANLRRAYTLAAALACACGLAFLSPELFRPAELAVSLAVAGALTVVHLRLGSWGRSRRAALVLDAVVVALVVLVVTDVSGYLQYLRPDSPSYLMGDGLVVNPEALAFSSRHHEGFWLGPINDMLGGRPMLVDTWSQYGVGVFYFLAAFFGVAPLGYGSLGLLVGCLTALQYSLAYGVLRIAGCPRTLAIPATAAAVLGLVLGSIGSPNDFPATGALRFGIPWLVVVLAVLATRAGRREQLCLGAATALVAVASIWSLETFVYTGATFVSAVGFRAAAMAPRTRRVRVFARSILQAGAGCVLAHVLLALGVRVFAGSWPDWSPYLAFLEVYSGSDLYASAVTPWSPGLLVALVYLASAICLAGLIARRHTAVDEHRPALMAIAATSGLGLSSLAYFVGHSHPNTLVLVSLPAVAVGCLWVTLLGDGGARAPRPVAIAAVAAGLWVAALIGVSGWPDATEKWQRTALAHVLPDGGQGGSIRDGLRLLWHSPPSDPRAPEAQRLLDRHLPRGAPALVLVEPELTLETLVRSERVNLLPISDPEEENLAPEQFDPRVLRAVERLRTGTLMLAQPAAFDAPTKPIAAYVPGSLLRLQKLAIDRVRARFRLQEVERGSDGLVILRLVARR